MKLKRALITAAGRDDQALPLQRLVDRDGRAKTALAIIVEEAATAGADEIAIVVRPGEEEAYRIAAGLMLAAAGLTFLTKRPAAK